MNFSVTPRNFFRWSLTLPILLPLLFLILGKHGIMVSLAVFLAGSLILGGMPYVAVFVTLMIISFRVPQARFIDWIRLAPFLMVLYMGPAILFVLFSGSGTLSGRTLSFLGAWLGMGVLCLLLGSVYALLVGLAYCGFYRMGLIDIADDVPPHVLMLFKKD